MPLALSISSPNLRPPTRKIRLFPPGQVHNSVDHRPLPRNQTPWNSTISYKLQKSKSNPVSACNLATRSLRTLTRSARNSVFRDFAILNKCLFRGMISHAIPLNSSLPSPSHCKDQISIQTSISKSGPMTALKMRMSANVNGQMKKFWLIYSVRGHKFSRLGLLGVLTLLSTCRFVSIASTDEPLWVKEWGSKLQPMSNSHYLDV